LFTALTEKQTMIDLIKELGIPMEWWKMCAYQSW
jgi:hypothetical protein